MSENKLLDLSFEFAVAIVNLVDGVTAEKFLYERSTSKIRFIRWGKYSRSTIRTEQERLCGKVRDCTQRIQ